MDFPRDPKFAEKAGRVLDRDGVARADDAEVTMIEGGDVGDAGPPGGSDHGSVDGAERQVVVTGDELYAGGSR